MADYTISSGNIFKDWDFPSADEELATKAKLALDIKRLIEGRGMVQGDAAACLGVNPVQITELKNGQLTGFTVYRLFSLLKKLDPHAEERLLEEYREQGLCWRHDDEITMAGQAASVSASTPTN